MVLENLRNVFSKNRPIFTFAARISSPAFILSKQKHAYVRNTISSHAPLSFSLSFSNKQH